MSDITQGMRLFNIEVYECIGNIRFLQISSEFYGLLSEIRGNKYGVGIFLPEHSTCFFIGGFVRVPIVQIANPNIERP